MSPDTWMSEGCFILTSPPVESRCLLIIESLIYAGLQWLSRLISYCNIIMYLLYITVIHSNVRGNDCDWRLGMFRMTFFNLLLSRLCCLWILFFYLNWNWIRCILHCLPLRGIHVLSFWSPSCDQCHWHSHLWCHVKLTTIRIISIVVTYQNISIPWLAVVYCSISIMKMTDLVHMHIMSARVFFQVSIVFDDHQHFDKRHIHVISQWFL